MTRSPAGWDVSSPVQAEVFVVWLDGDTIALTGPCGPGPWILELGASDHPVEVVDRIVRDVVGEPLLVHSTSWRRDRDAVILTFIVVIEAAQAVQNPSLPVSPAELARGGATFAPATIGVDQVLEHGLRHLAWLAAEDAGVQAVLSEPWRIALAAHTPEPFRNLG